MNIPNSLSLARICLIPFFVAAYFLPYEWGVYVAIAIFLICCFTDFLDGFIARKYNMVTDLGKLLDPIADKILICAALFCVVATNPLKYFYNSIFEMPVGVASTLGSVLLTVGAILILARELLISAVRQIAASKGTVLQANIFGKIKTVMQDISLPLLILMNVASMYTLVSYRPSVMWTDVIWLISVIVFGLAIIMTIVSGVIYLIQNRDVFKQ